MVLSEEETINIIEFVKVEPRTVHEIAKKIKRSWVTTDSYLKQIKNNTGLIEIKTFRKGSHGALKVVYYNSKDLVLGSSIQKELSNKIKSVRSSKDFDMFDIFQFVPDENKKLETKYNKTQKFISILEEAENSLLIFSGNLSFLSLKEGKIDFADAIESLLKRKVNVKILCRLDYGALKNISKISYLIDKYSPFLEVRHGIQPLRGIIIDDKLARFTEEYNSKSYKGGEIDSPTKLFYEIYDKEWVAWLQKLFWGMFRVAIDYKRREEQFKKFL